MGAEGTKEPEIEDAGVVAVGPIELDGVRADQAGGDYTHAGGISLEDSQGIVRLLFALRAAGGAGADATKLGQGELAVLSVFPFDEQTLVGDLDLQILGRNGIVVRAAMGGRCGDCRRVIGHGAEFT